MTKTLGYTIKRDQVVRSLRTGLIYTVSNLAVTYIALTDQFGNTISWAREDFHEFFEPVED